MKKRILAMLLSALLVMNISACVYVPKNKIERATGWATEETPTVGSKNNDSQSGLESPEHSNQQAEKIYSTQELVEALELSNLFASVLRCEDMFYNTNEDTYMYLNNYKYAYDYISEWKTISVATIDMDGDGQNEMLIEGLHDIAIFRELEGKIYSYGFTFRSMNTISNDGTFSWNRSAGNIYGSSKLQFDGIVHHCIELYRVEYHGTEDAKYYINGDEVSLEEMQSYGEQPLSEKVDWYAWNKDTIEDSFRSDNQVNGK